MRDMASVAAFARVLADETGDLQRALLREIPGTSFYVVDRDLRLTFVEGAGLRHVGLEPQKLEGRLLGEALPDVASRVLVPVRESLAGAPSSADLTVGGRTVRLYTAPLLGRGENLLGVLGVVVDVTARRRAEDALHDIIARQTAVVAVGRRALEGASISQLLQRSVEVVAQALGCERVTVVHYDIEAGIANPCATHGWTDATVRQPLPLSSDFRTRAAELARTPRIVDEVDESVAYSQFLFRHGVRSYATVSIGTAERPWGILSVQSPEPRAFNAQQVDFLVSIAHVLWEAIERREQEEANEYAALHDELTGLPNRRQLLTRLQEGLDHARETRSALAVLLLDLDNFKVINDSLGHSGGDSLLQELAPRLLAAARDDDTVARLGGDEFVFVCRGVVSEEHALAIAERLQRATEEPFVVAGRERTLRSSVGIVLSDGTGAPQDLLRDADTAMYRAKHAGRARCETFSAAMRARAIARERTETDLQDAADRGELLVHYQPLYRVADRRLVSVEALMRWERRDHGLVPPNEFIPIAEESGLIVELGQWVLNAAARQLCEWRATLRAPTTSLSPSTCPAASCSAVAWSRRSRPRSRARGCRPTVWPWRSPRRCCSMRPTRRQRPWPS